MYLMLNHGTVQYRKKGVNMVQNLDSSPGFRNMIQNEPKMALISILGHGVSSLTDAETLKARHRIFSII